MRLLLSALLIGLLLAGCKKPGEGAATPPDASAGPKELSEVEPNDGPANAMELREASRVQATLHAEAGGADEDFFRIASLGSAKQGRFDVSAIPGVDLKVELLDRDANPIALFNSEPEGKGETIATFNLGQAYLIKVSSVKKGSGGAYVATFAVSDAQPGLEAEPNNRAVDATPLALGAPMTGALSDKADEDWYRMEVPLPAGLASAAPAPTEVAAPAPTPVQAAAPAPAPAPEQAAGAPAAAPQPVVAEGAPTVPAGPAPVPASPNPAVVKLDITGVPEVRLQVEIANEAQAVFYTAKSREPGEGIQVRNVALRPGETVYYVTVKSAWTGMGKDARRGYNAGATYALTITPEDAAANAELEPNDEPAKATPFYGDGFKQGYFAPKGDVDYYLIRADRPSLLKIDLAGLDRVDSMLTLVKPGAEDDAKEEALLKANDGGVREGEMLLNVAAGPGQDVLLRVEAAPRQQGGKWVRDSENADQPYKLTITSRPDEGFDEREPNNDPAVATPIEANKPMRGLIHPKRDADYYRIDLSSSPVKVPLKATVTGILKVDVSLGLFRLDSEGSPVLVQRSEKGKGEQPEIIRYAADPGIYVLEVRDARNLQSNFLDAYQLTVEREQ